MRTQVTMLRAAIVDRRLRRIYLAYAGFSMAEHATWWATLVYAFDRGGVGTAGRLAVVSLLTAMVVAPFAAWSGDRFRPDRALLVAYVVQAAVVAATAILMSVDAAVPAYVAALVVLSAVTVSRPLVSSLLPLVVSRPADLVAGNVVVGSLGQFGLFLGPLLGAALMVAGSPALVFAVSAVLLALGAAAMAGARTSDAPPPTISAGGVIRSVFGGLTAVWSTRSLGAVVALLFAGTLITGIGHVALVAFADERLGGGGGTAGVLGAATGLGGFVGIVSMTASAGRSPVWPALVVASTLTGLPFAALAATDATIIAILLLASSGVGLGMIAVLSTVAIQRLASEDTLARVFGVHEAMRMAALASGAGVATLTIERLGLGPALVWLGLGVSAAALVCTVGFVVSGADVAAPDPKVIDRLVADQLFAPLGCRAIERLAEGAERTVRPAGSDIITEGDIGRRYFLLLDGHAEVRSAGSQLGRLGPGDSFGEIALLQDRPRTATVRAETEVIALTIERDRFVTAVTGHPKSVSAATAVIEGYQR